MKMADDERYNQAAIILQKYFRMWQVQAQLVREELYNLGYEKQVGTSCEEYQNVPSNSSLLLSTETKE